MAGQHESEKQGGRAHAGRLLKIVFFLSRLRVPAPKAREEKKEASVREETTSYAPTLMLPTTGVEGSNVKSNVRLKY